MERQLGAGMRVELCGGGDTLSVCTYVQSVRQLALVCSCVHLCVYTWLDPACHQALYEYQCIYYVVGSRYNP